MRLAAVGVVGFAVGVLVGSYLWTGLLAEAMVEWARIVRRTQEAQ